MDKVLESTLHHEFDSYLVIARSDLHWDAILTLLAEFNELDDDMLYRLLERCYRISWEYIEDNGGLFDVLTGEEMLESDLAAEREERRESKGFVSPVAAALFLSMARSTGLKKIIASTTPDPATQAYLKAAGMKPGTASRPLTAVQAVENTAAKATPVKVIRFLETLRTAEVLPGAYEKLISSGESLEHHLPLAKAMRLIDRRDPELYAQRLMELTYLSNILISGCSFQGRTFRPVEAAEAAFSVCNLAVEFLLGTGAKTGEARRVEQVMELLETQPLVKTFQVGWKVLNDEVVGQTAEALLAFLDRLKTEMTDRRLAHDLDSMSGVLRSRISTGRPLKVDEHLDPLQGFLDGETAGALTALVQEYPTMSEVIASHGRHRSSPFISSQAHLQTIRRFLEEVLRIRRSLVRQRRRTPQRE